MTRRELAVRAAFTCAVAALAGWQCFLPPIVGLADNGDFEKITLQLGLAHADPREPEAHFGYIQRTYVDLGTSWLQRGYVVGDYLTSETLIAAAALALDRSLGDDRVFDIRMIGAAHAALFVLGLASIAAATAGLPARILCLALLAFLFTDVGYVSLFNTFYSQTASLVFLLLAFGAALGWIRAPMPRPWLAVAFFLSTALYVTSKPQAAPHALFFAFLGVAIARGRKTWPRAVTAAALGIALVGLAYFRATPPSIRTHSIFNLVFWEILPHSPTPKADLLALGGEAKWIRWSGRNIYEPGAPQDNRAVLDRLATKIGFGDVALFYVWRPAQLRDTLARAAAEAFKLRSAFGNFEHRPGVEFGRRATRMAAWSDFRQAHIPATVTWIALFFAGNLAVAAAIATRAPRVESRLLGLVLAVAALAAVTDFLVCALANAHVELERHLFIFQALFDLCLAADVALAAIGLRALWRRLPRPAAARPAEV